MAKKTTKKKEDELAKARESKRLCARKRRANPTIRDDENEAKRKSRFNKQQADAKEREKRTLKAAASLESEYANKNKALAIAALVDEVTNGRGASRVNAAKALIALADATQDVSKDIDMKFEIIPDDVDDSDSETKAVSA